VLVECLVVLENSGGGSCDVGGGVLGVGGGGVF
jgi:hypothetical protein